MQSLGVGGRNSGRILYAYFIAAEFSAKMVCNFPGDEVSSLFDSITEVQRHFGPF